MSEFKYIEFLNRLLRNNNLKYSDYSQLSSAPLVAGMDGFWGFIDAATKDIGQTVYDGIKNFTSKITNPDVATVESLLAMSQMVGYPPLLGRTGATLTKELSKLQDKLSVSRYVYDKTLDSDLFVCIPSDSISLVWSQQQPSPYTVDSAVPQVSYFKFSYLLDNGFDTQLSSYESTLQTSGLSPFPRLTWYYEDNQESTVRTVSGNSIWPFESPQSSGTFEFQRIYDEASNRVYVCNIGQIAWKQYLTSKYYQFFATILKTARNGNDEYVDLNMAAWELQNESSLTFSKYNEWEEVDTYKASNGIQVDIKSIVNLLDFGTIEWKDLDAQVQTACLISLQQNINNLLEAGTTTASYVQWNTINNLMTIISSLGFTKYPDQYVEDLNSIEDLVAKDLLIDNLIKASSEILANYSLAFQYDRQMVKHQIAAYSMAGTDRMLEKTIAKFIEDNISSSNVYGIEIPNQDSSLLVDGYVFQGNVNIVKWLDTINYSNIAQLDEVASSGKTKSNSSIGYDLEYFASILGYPFSATSTSTSWLADPAIPQSIKTQAQQLASITSLEGRYWEDDSSLWSTLPWSTMILPFYRSLGVDEKPYTNYTPYLATDYQMIIKTVSTVDEQNNTSIKPLRLLSQSVIDAGIKLFPDIEGDETQTSTNQADRGLFYYVMWIHQLGAAKGKADIDTIEASSTWRYYKSYSAAKQNPEWFMNMENVNHLSFKPISYLAALSKRVVERFTTEVVVLQSFINPSDLALYLQTAIDNSTGMTIDSWRNENIDWGIYSTFQETTDATAPDGTLHKYMTMDGPWSLKFLHEYVTNGVELSDLETFREYWAHLDLEESDLIAIKNHFFDSQTSTFISSLEGKKIKSYAKFQDNTSLTMFAGSDSIVARKQGWPCGVQLQTSACNDYVIDCSQIEASQLSGIDNMVQPLSNFIVISKPSNMQIYKIDLGATPPILLEAPGQSSSTAMVDMTTVYNGKWIGSINDLLFTTEQIAFSYYAYDTQTGVSSLSDYQFQISALSSNNYEVERYKSGFIVGYEITDGWEISMFDIVEKPTLSRTLSWSIADASMIDSMYTYENPTNGNISQIVSTYDSESGLRNYYILPDNDGTAQISSLNFDDVVFQYGNFYRAYSPWTQLSGAQRTNFQLSLAQQNGVIKGIYGSLNGIMKDFELTTLNSLGGVGQLSTLLSEVWDTQLDIDKIRIPSNSYDFGQTSTKQFEYVTAYKPGIVLETNDENIADQALYLLDYNESTNSLSTGVKQHYLFVNDFIYNFNLDKLQWSSGISSYVLTSPFGALKSYLDSDWGVSIQLDTNATFNDYRYYEDINPFYYGFCLQYRQFASGRGIADIAGNNWFFSDAPSFNYYTIECISYETRSVNSSSKMSNSNIFSIEIENSNLNESQRNYLQPKLVDLINSLKAANTQLLNIVWKGKTQ